MDAKHFDHLVRALAAPSARRPLLRYLATLPLVGAISALLSDADVAAKGKRKRHKKPHHHRKHTGNRAGTKKNHKQQKKTCKPEPTATTCAGTCGPVKNNCQQTIDCGSCACDPPCDVCFICQDGPTTPGDCVVDPAQQGDVCGDPGQVCQADGTCACDERSCPACTTCGDDGACQGCSGCCDGETCVADCGACQVCDEGQCSGCPDCCDASGVCQDGDSEAACGRSGTCEVCTGQEECQDQRCVCVPDCTGKFCGSDGCTGTCAPGCGPHSTCTDGGTRCACDFVSCDDACCAESASCCGSGCVDLESDPEHCGDCETACGTGQTCQGGVCGVSCGSDFCPVASEICVDGACRACTVTCTGTPAECGVALQAALTGGNGQTLYVCHGIYQGNFGLNLLDQGVTVIGAGQGDNPSSDTILDAKDHGRVVEIPDATGTIELQRLRITGGRISGAERGAGISHFGTTLRMTDATVTGNTIESGLGGGIWSDTNRTLELTRCTISDSHTGVGGQGGGIYVQGPTTLTDCLVEGNSADLGGGMLISIGVTTLDGNTKVRDNRADASANSSGGGIFVNRAGLVIAATCRVTGNTAPAGNGGGITRSVFGSVQLLGDEDPSPIVIDNCQENCAGSPVLKCAPGGTCPP